MNAFDAYDALAAETTNILPPPRPEPAAAEPAPRIDSRYRASDLAPPEPAIAQPLFRATDATTPGIAQPQPPLRGNDERASAPPPAASAAADRVATASAIAPTAAIAEPAASPVSESPTVPPQPAAHPESAAEAAPDDAGGRFAEIFTRPSPAQLWIAGAGALALLLVVQLAIAYRSEIVARSPTMRSALTSICEHVGCRVSLPQRPELLRIEASDVHMVDASRPQLIQLTATLRSYAGYDLAYPALDLVLTNANEHALARRIFRPDEYLDATRDPDAGIPANAEITVALDLDTGDLSAAGFRLDLLAAPR